MARLEEICSLITDGSHFSPEDEGVGYPMFSVKDMTPKKDLLKAKYGLRGRYASPLRQI